MTSGTTPAPTAERPLTVADRTPQVGDVIRATTGINWLVGESGPRGKGWHWFTNQSTGVRRSRKMGEFLRASYVSRADGGPITVPVS